MQKNQQGIKDALQLTVPEKDVPFTFGIYAGSITGAGEGMLHGPVDDPVRISAALDGLQGGSPVFLVRVYAWYVGSSELMNVTPLNPEIYVSDRRKLDLVLCYRDASGDVEGWLEIIRATIRRYGPYLAVLQIAEEPNNPDASLGGDGAFPHVQEAIIRGVVVAKEEAQRHGYSIQVGFNAALSFDPNDTFWSRIAALATPSFLNALDYVGLDFFPDVFRRLAPDGEPGDLRSSVEAVLKHYREVNLKTGNIPPSIPIHIGENGWATGTGRSYERQAVTLETIVNTIYQHRTAFNVTHYEYHSLRDANSAKTELLYQLGLMRDDYTPKPAFDVYRRLIAHPYSSRNDGQREAAQADQDAYP